MAHVGYRGPLKAILLDWAGTTMDYGCFAPAVVFIDVFERKGVPITMEEARAPMGAHKRVHIAAIAQIPSVAKRWREAHGRPCTDADIDEMFVDFVPRQLAVLARYADLVPGTLEAVSDFRDRGLRIGSTTGYTTPMMKVLWDEAKKRGYSPDVCVCADEVPGGRPEPWMCIENMKRLKVYPPSAMVKVGDTLPDILEGLNAGMWTIGLAKTGNEMGVKAEDLARMNSDELDRRLARAYHRMRDTGAHYVVDSISDVPPILDLLEARIASGDRP